MRKHLTIGELSKMLGISTHSIRYYEKEGLIKPTEISDGGYRLYDFDDMHLLSAIMLLRDSEISLKSIKRLFDDYNKDNCLTVFKQSYQTIEEQIEKLLKVKKRLQENIELIQQTNVKERLFEFKEYSQRKLKIVKESNFDMSYSIKELFDIFTKHRIDMSQLYQGDMVYYLTDDSINYCIPDDNASNELEIVDCKAGQYLCYTRYDAEDDLIEESINEFFNYITTNNIPYEGDLLLIVRTNISILGQSGYPIELQIKTQKF